MCLWLVYFHAMHRLNLSFIKSVMLVIAHTLKASFSASFSMCLMNNNNNNNQAAHRVKENIVDSYPTALLPFISMSYIKAIESVNTERGWGKMGNITLIITTRWCRQIHVTEYIQCFGFQCVFLSFNLFCMKHACHSIYTIVDTRPESGTMLCVLCLLLRLVAVASE